MPGLCRRALRCALATASIALVAVAGVADAHVVQRFGSYDLAIGWLREPTYVGVENAVQVVVKDRAGKPISDLTGDDLKVTVTADAQASDLLSLEPSFDEDTGLGTRGEYLAALIPTVPGVYTFHLQGSIRGQPVDRSFTSSDKTFDAVRASADAEFPVRLPSAAELSQRLDRLDARVQALGNAGANPSAGPAGQAATEAAEARQQANQAIVVAASLGTLGALGLLFGGIALVVALRPGRGSARRP